MSVKAERGEAGWIVEGRLTRNALRCLNCGQTIESKSRHDWRTCGCPNRAMVDGGLCYQRWGAVDPSRIESLAEFSPPSVVTDTIGKPCESEAVTCHCGCDGLCPACVVDGEPTGLASVKLTVPCGRCYNDPAKRIGCPACRRDEGVLRIDGTGTVTVRVIPEQIEQLDDGRYLITGTQVDR